MTRRCLALLLAAASSAASSGDQWDEAAQDAYSRLVLRQAPSVERSGDGVLYAMGGRVDFVEREVVPCVAYLRRLGKKATRYALVGERRLLRSPSVVTFLSFFDEVIAYEDVGGPNHPDVRVKVKLVKAYAMLYAPFERFVWLDFDSRPCAPDFAATLFRKLEEKQVDALLHDQRPAEQDKLSRTDDRHYRIEHNSAIAVFDARTRATQAALTLFVDAFSQFRTGGTPKRDQPPLMVALRFAFHHRNFTHADLGPLDFCRKNSSAIVSCDAGCLVVHKPMKYDPGAKVVGLLQGGPNATTAPLFRALLTSLKLVNKRHPDCNDLDDADCKVLVGGVEDPATLKAITSKYPRAKVVAVVVSEESCHDQPIGAPPSVVSSADGDDIALFTLDLATGDPTESDWRRFCAFLEIWSTCKSRDLANIVAAWRRRRRRRPPCSSSSSSSRS